MYNDNTILLDYDGILLDSEERMMKLRKENENLSWDEFFDFIDWDKLYNESVEINDSLKILKELQSKRKEIYIITKTHVNKEGISKIKRLRNENIEVPIFIVPPHIKKSEIFIPNQKSILVDDSIKNINEWEDKGGYGILFDTNCKEENKQKVKSLEFLIRG